MKRFRIVAISAVWLGVMVFTLDRINISMAAPKIMDDLGISGAQMGIILSFYFWGYLPGNLLGGVLADTLNLRRFVSSMFLAWGAFTAMTGLCRTPLHFYGVRWIFGLSEGMVVPCFNKLQNNWLLPQERGRYWGIYSGVGKIGLAFGLPFVGWLIQLYDWRIMFFITGALTLLLTFTFYLLMRDHPEEHPWASAEEKRMIREALEKDRVTFGGPLQGRGPTEGARKKIPFREAFGSLAREKHLWVICFGFFLGYSLYTANLTWLPGYLVKERGYTVTESGVYLIIPYLVAFLGPMSNGYLGDVTGNRTLFGVIYMILGCPAMMGVLWSDSLVGVMFFAGMTMFFATGMLNSTYILLYDVVAPEIMGTALGIVSASGGAASGIVAPLVIGYLLDLTGSFFWGFTIFALASLVAGLVFIPIIFWERRVKAEKAKRRSAEHEAWGVGEKVKA